MEKHCGHGPLKEETAKNILSENGINRTKVKDSNPHGDSQSHRPMSVAEIHSKLKENCDVSTVFRSITQFKEKGLVHEVNLDEGFVRYELISHESDHHHHHHHIRCRKCGDIKNIENCDLGPFEKLL